MNPDADAEILDRFADDKFWGVRMEVVRHANVGEATLRRLLESSLPKRGVVHHAARASWKSAALHLVQMACRWRCL
jgi:hypothetical protein